MTKQAIRIALAGLINGLVSLIFSFNIILLFLTNLIYIEVVFVLLFVFS